MDLKELIQQITQEFANLKDKITAKLTEKNATIQAEKEKNQTTTRKLEEKLKENSDNEQVLTTLLTDFQELIKSLEQSQLNLTN